MPAASTNVGAEKTSPEPVPFVPTASPSNDGTGSGDPKEPASAASIISPLRDGVQSGSTTPNSGGGDVEKGSSVDSGLGGNGEGDQPKLPKWRVFVLMLALATVNFIAALTTLIMTTSLPVIAQAWKASDSDYAWIGSAYYLGVLSTVPFWGKISDIFGRKKILVTANALFLLGDIVAATSVSLGMLIGGRVVQGLGSGGIFTLVNVCIGDMFSVRERALHYGIVGGVWATASAFGPLIGGAITQSTSWRWCYYINIPMDVISVALLVTFLDIHTPKTPLKQGLVAIDWAGSITFAAASIMLMFGLQSGGVSYPWGSPTVICLLVFGIVTFGVFAIIQKKFAKYPVMPLELFKSGHIILTLLICFIQSGNAVAIIIYLPFYFQIILGVSPLMSGVYFLPFALILGTFSITTGMIIRKVGDYTWLIRGGSFLITLGVGLFANLTDTRNWPNIVLGQLIAAVGVGFLYQAPMIAFQAAIKQKDLATGQATFQVTRTFSQGVSIIVGQVVFQSQVQRKAKQLANISSELVNTLTAGNVIAAEGALKSLPAEQREAVRAALATSLSRMWMFYAAMAFVGFVASLFLKKIVLSEVHEVVKTGLPPVVEKADGEGIGEVAVAAQEKG